VKLHGFTNADWAGNPTDRKSTLGGIFSIGSIVVLGTVGNRDPWHLVQWKRNTWQQAKLHVRLSG
jgi:hypothetical protein